MAARPPQALRIVRRHAMAAANSEQYANQAAMHATEARTALNRATPFGTPDEDEHYRLLAQVEMQHALVCAVLALRDTIREGHA